MTAPEHINTIIERLTQLLNDGPILPGKIKEQWTVCGKPTCRCADPDNPRRHGPYPQLSFTIAGKSSTMFIKAKDLEAAQQCTRRYHEFRQLSKQLAQAYVADARKNGFDHHPNKSQE